MKKQVSIIIMWTSLLTFLGCGQTNSKQNTVKSDNTVIEEQFVSMDCQTGDITLTLNSTDQTFNLTILFWDDKSNKHTGQESIAGKWAKTDKLLTLNTADKNKIVYELTTTNMKIGNTEINSKTYGFKSNDKEFFGTNFDLVEKEQTDKFLIKATKEN